MIQEQHVLPVNCFGCGQVGSALWEDGADHKQASAKLIVLSNGFHREDDPAKGKDIKIVCDFCDGTVAD
jgi:hypothetical protein